jgi:hypothetical protein
MNTQEWAQRAEIVASCAVVVTLVFVIVEIRSNTAAIERRSILDRASTLNTPFFTSPDMPTILAKVKAVDGMDPIPQALADRYSLSAEESILWERHLNEIWIGLEADYLHGGPSEHLEWPIRGLLSTPDNQLYWDLVGSEFSAEFSSYVDSFRPDM